MAHPVYVDREALVINVVTVDTRAMSTNTPDEIARLARKHHTPFGESTNVAANPMQYDELMLRYHVAFHLPRAAGDMVVAEALDFPGAVTQGFDLADARLMIASAIEDLAQCLLEEGKALPTPNPDAAADADLFELVPLTIHVGTLRA